MKPAGLVVRLETFRKEWISNPAAALEFARLVRDVHQCPRRDHADENLLEWISEQEQIARYLGIK